jgi:hypothetical protein
MNSLEKCVSDKKGVSLYKKLIRVISHLQNKQAGFKNDYFY